MLKKGQNCRPSRRSVPVLTSRPLMVAAEPAAANSVGGKGVQPGAGKQTCQVVRLLYGLLASQPAGSA